MHYSHLRSCLLLGCALLASLSRGSAQESRQPDVPKLEEIPAALTALEADINRKADNARTIVEREAAEKRLSDSIAQSLRWSLRTAMSSAGTLDLRGALATARVPADNEAVARAFKEVEISLAEYQSRRTALHAQTTKEIRGRLLEALRSATQPGDLAQLERTIESLREAWQKKSSVYVSGVGYSSFNDPLLSGGFLNLTHPLRLLLEAEQGGKPDSIREAINGLQSFGQDREIQSSSELRNRLDRALQPFTVKHESAREALESALRAGQARDALAPLLAPYEEAVNQLRQLRQFSPGANELSNSSAAYRTLVEALGSTATDDPDTVRNRVREANAALPRLGSKHTAEFTTLLGKLGQRIAAAARAAGEARAAKVRTRLAAIRQPAELEELAREIEDWSRERSQSGPDREPWAQLARTLATLAAGWNSGTLYFLQARSGEMEPAGPGYHAELKSLRERIERDALSRVLEVPELLAPPLNEKPPGAALEAVSDALAAKGEWRRLYRLLEARATLQGRDPRQAPDETVTAVRSFLAGQNFELAEQWADAADAYKAVLRTASERAPIKAAAERLKTLTREHPEALTAPRPASQPR